MMNSLQCRQHNTSVSDGDLLLLSQPQCLKKWYVILHCQSKFTQAVLSIYSIGVNEATLRP